MEPPVGLHVAVALVGFAAKVLFAHRVEAVSVGSYVTLGWMPIIALPALYHLAPAGRIPSYHRRRRVLHGRNVLFVYDEQVKHFHAVWHLCVISGSVCHFLGLLFFVVRGGV